MGNKYSRKLFNKLKALNIHLRPFKYKLIKLIRNIIFVRRILKCKKFSKSIALNPKEISILERLETKGYSLLPKTFFSKDEIEDLYSYLEKTMRKKENNINNIFIVNYLIQQ